MPNSEKIVGKEPQTNLKMLSKKTILAPLFTCLIAMTTLQAVQKNDVSARLGYKVAQELKCGANGTGVCQAGGAFVGGAGGAYAGAKVGAMIGASCGPVGAFVGGLIGTCAGCY